MVGAILVVLACKLILEFQQELVVQVVNKLAGVHQLALKEDL